MGARRMAFYAVVVVFVGLFGAIAAPDLVVLFTGLFPATDLGAHRVHELVIAATLWTILLGMLAQVRRPETAVAGVYQSALVVLSVFVAGALGSYFRPPVLLFLVLAAVAGALHPAGREVLSALRPDGLNRAMLALVVVAAIPLGAFAADQVALQAGTADAAHHADHAGADHEEAHREHVEEGHFASAAGFAIAIVVLGLLASLLPPGWWLSAWSAGGMAAVYGLASALYPDLASSAGTLWGGLAILWGVAFVATAELTQEETVPSLLDRWRANRTRGTGE